MLSVSLPLVRSGGGEPSKAAGVEGSSIQRDKLPQTAATEVAVGRSGAEAGGRSFSGHDFLEGLALPVPLTPGGDVVVLPSGEHWRQPNAVFAEQLKQRQQQQLETAEAQLAVDSGDIAQMVESRQWERVVESHSQMSELLNLQQGQQGSSVSFIADIEYSAVLLEAGSSTRRGACYIPAAASPSQQPHSFLFLLCPAFAAAAAAAAVFTVLIAL